MNELDTPPNSPLPAIDDNLISPHIRKIALVACLSALLCGYDSGIVSSALIAIGDDLGGRVLSDGENGLIVSATSIGALMGALPAGTLADRFGRKRILIAASVLFALGAVEQSAANILRELVLGRILVGVAAGLASSVCPVYLSECSQASIRGRLLTLFIVMITFGQVLAYCAGALFYNVTHGWRWMLLSGVLPAILQLAFIFGIPESPRYSIRKGNTLAAEKALSRIYQNAEEEQIRHLVSAIQQAIRHEDETALRLTSFSALRSSLWEDRPTRRALIVACGLQFFQQFTGFNSLMYYSGIILQSAGFAHPPLFAIFVAVSNFACTLVVLRYIDKTGRRPLLLRTVLGMFAGLLAMSFCFLFIPGKGNALSGPNAASILGLVSMTFYCCSYALGLGNLPWTIQSEIFSYNVRGVSNSIATCVNWTANLILAATFLHLVKLVALAGAFAIYAAITLVAWIFIYRKVPETSGMTLEEARKVFETRQDTAKTENSEESEPLAPSRPSDVD